MSTDEKQYDAEGTKDDEGKMSEGLTVIDRQGTALSLPRITGFGVVERCEEDGTPLSTELDANSGSMNLVIDKRAFVKQVFNGLIIAGGEHKDKLLSQELIDAEIERGKELLLKEDLFEGETSEEYRQYQLNVSKMFTAADNKRKELKDPVTKINKAFQGLLEATLGDLIEIRAKVMVRTKEHKVEVEERDRKAKQADAALREATDNELSKVAYLAVDAMKLTAEEVKVIAADLLASEFVPHEGQAVAYVEAVAKASEALADMYQEKTKAEAGAALQKKEDDKKAAADKEELDKLRAGQADQKLKDAAGTHVSRINELLGKCVGAEFVEIDKFVEEAEAKAKECKDNKYFGEVAVSFTISKMKDLRFAASKKSEDEFKAKKLAADKVKAEVADKKVKEDREKAEVAAALEKANQKLLLDAGFVLDGLSYQKGGIHFHAGEAKRAPSSDVGAFIVKADKKIAANEAAAEKEREKQREKIELERGLYAEACDLAKKHLRFDIGDKTSSKWSSDSSGAQITIVQGQPNLLFHVDRFINEEEEKRKSNAMKVEEMTAGVMKCDDHDAVVDALLNDRIPHVRFG